MTEIIFVWELRVGDGINNIKRTYFLYANSGVGNRIYLLCGNSRASNRNKNMKRTYFLCGDLRVGSRNNNIKRTIGSVTETIM